MPMPQPAVGGNPYSRDVMKPSSTYIASSSPCALAYKRVRVWKLRVIDHFQAFLENQAPRLTSWTISLRQVSVPLALESSNPCHFATSKINKQKL